MIIIIIVYFHLHQMSDIEEDEDTSLPYGAHPVSLTRKTQEKLEVIVIIGLIVSNKWQLTTDNSWLLFSIPK